MPFILGHLPPATRKKTLKPLKHGGAMEDDITVNLDLNIDGEEVVAATAVTCGGREMTGGSEPGRRGSSGKGRGGGGGGGTGDRAAGGRGGGRRRGRRGGGRGGGGAPAGEAPAEGRHRRAGGGEPAAGRSAREGLVRGGAGAPRAGGRQSA